VNTMANLTGLQFAFSDLSNLDALQRSGYPLTFIEHNFRVPNRPDDPESSERPKVFLRVQFRGDAAAEIFRRKLERSLKANCRPVKLVIVFTSRPLIATQTKDRLSSMATSNVVYRFTCGTCGMQYIGHTIRRLKDRAGEHLRKRIQKAPDGNYRSSITEHLIKEGHYFDTEKCFEILYHTRTRNLLKFLEAVAIRKFKPALNVQKEFDYKLQLQI